VDVPGEILSPPLPFELFFDPPPQPATAKARGSTRNA